MSYCRINRVDSDIYLYMDMDKVLTCVHSRADFKTSFHIEMYNHLLEHKEKGLKVPQKAYDRLKNESKDLRY